ncbi:MAG: hypothetical protein ACP5OV_00540 [Acidimicrobiales bacterium]
MTFMTAQYPQATSPTFATTNSAYANQPSIWEIQFTATTALANPDTIKVTFPAGFLLASAPAFTLGGAFSCTSYTGTGSSAPPAINLTVPSGCTLAASATGTIEFTSGITNPPATSLQYVYTNFSVSTSVDTQATTPASSADVSALVASGSSVTAVSATGLHATAGSWNDTWTYGFTTSAANALTGPGPYGGALVAGDEVVVTFPSGFTIVPSPTIQLGVAFGGGCTGTGSTTGDVVTITLAGTCTLGAGTATTVQIGGVTDPVAGNSYQYAVQTTEDYLPTPGTLIIAPATSVTGVSFTAASYAGNATTTWEVGFTPSTPGGLAAGDQIVAQFPAGDFSYVVTPTVTFALGFSGGAACANPAFTYVVASGKLTVTVPNGCSLAGGTPAALTLSNLVNPPAGTTYTNTDFSVATSVDSSPTSPSSVSPIVAAGSAVSTVTFAPHTQTYASGNQTWSWQVGFTPATGLVAGDTVSATFAPGFGLSGTVAAGVTLGGFTGTCTSPSAVVTGSTVTVTLPSGCSLSASTPATLTVTVTNPPVTDLYTASQFAVSTSEDPSPISPSSVVAIVASGNSVSNVNFASAPSTGGVAATWTVGFTTSAVGAPPAYGGALTPGDTVAVTFPAGTGLAAHPMVSLTAAGSTFSGTGCASAAATTAGTTVVITVPASCSIAAAAAAAISIDATNPPAGTYTSGFTVATSEDPTAAPFTSSVSLGAQGSHVSNVSFSELTTAGNTATTMTVGFTPSLPGSLGGGSTITVVLPTSATVPYFAVAAGPQVTFASGFSGGAACVPVTGSYAAGSLVVTLPAGCSLSGGQPATVTFSLTNPPATSTYLASQFSVATSADPTPVPPASVAAITPSGTAVSAVSFAASDSGGNQTDTLTAAFTSSSHGLLEPGDTVSVTIPSGFALASLNSVVPTVTGFTTCTVNGSDFAWNGSTLVFTLPASCSLAISTPATVQMSVTNPPAPYSPYDPSLFAVATSEDPATVTPTSIPTLGPSGTQVSNVTFAGATNNKANTTESWTVGFQASSLGALVSQDQIYVTFNPAFAITQYPQITLSSSFGANCLAYAQAPGHSVFITLFGTCDLANSASATVTISGVTNPPHGTYSANTFVVSTSEDPTPAYPATDVVIGPTGGTPTNVDFTAGTYAGNVGTVWTAAFTATSTGALFPGDTVTVHLPTSAGTSDLLVSATPTIHFSSGFVGCVPTVGTFTSSTGVLSVTLPAGCTLGNGIAAALSFAATNPPDTTTYTPSQFSVATSEDTTAASPLLVHAIVPSGTTVTVTQLYAGSYVANQSTSWVAQFMTSPVGALPPYGGALVAGDTVSVTFPAGFVLTGASVTLATGFTGACIVGVGGLSISGTTIVATLPAACALAAGTGAKVIVNGVVNPPVTDVYGAGQFIVVTSEDPLPASPTAVAAITASGHAVSGVSFVPSTAKANQPDTWTIGFSTSNAGGYLGGLVAGDTVTLTLPPTITVPLPASVTLGGAFAGNCTLSASDIVVSAGRVVITLPPGCTLANGAAGQVTLVAVNPPITRPWTAAQFAVSTSEDPASVAASSVASLVLSGHQVSAVTFTAAALSGNHSTTWSVGFSTSNAGGYLGGLVAGDTVTINMPTNFTVPPTTAVTLGGAFSGSCTVPSADVAVVVATVTVTIPAGCTLANGAAGVVSFGVVNPPVTVRYLATAFTVATSEDPLAASPATVSALVPSGTSVVPGSVSFTAYPNAAGTAALWSIGFTPSTTGDLVAGDTISVTFPSGITIANPALVTFTSGFAGCAPVSATFNAQMLFVPLPEGCTLKASTPAMLTVTSTGALAASYAASGFTVLTSEDPNPVSPTAVVVVSSAAGSGSGSSTVTPVAPPSGIASSALGVPQSVVVGTTAASLIVSSGTTIFELTIPVGALPAGTTVSLYPVTSTSSVAGSLPGGSSAIAAAAVSWLAPGGSAPVAATALTLTAADPAIVAGDTVDVLTSSGVTIIATATTSDSITANFSSDPVFVVATAIALQPQAALTLAGSRTTVGHPVTLVATGGSGSGAVTYAVTGGTANGCSLNGATLSVRGPGTCVIQATKAGDLTYESATATATFVFARALPARPAMVQVTFSPGSAVLSAHAQGLLAALAHRLVRGALVRIVGYGSGSSALAHRRVASIEHYLLGRVRLRVVATFAVAAKANVGRVLTLAQ